MDREFDDVARPAPAVRPSPLAGRSSTKSCPSARSSPKSVTVATCVTVTRKNSQTSRKNPHRPPPPLPHHRHAGLFSSLHHRHDTPSHQPVSAASSPAHPAALILFHSPPLHPSCARALSTRGLPLSLSLSPLCFSCYASPCARWISVEDRIRVGTVRPADVGRASRR